MDSLSLRRWWPVLLPLSYLLHLAEEWWGGEGFATLASASYSPGLITGVFLYVPFGTLAVTSGRRQLSPGTFGAAVLAGVFVHALVAVIAFA